VTRPSVYEYLGGAPALDAFVQALHERCLADPVLVHPFSHVADPDHLPHLAAYLGEVFGGPPEYSTRFGSQSSMLGVHAGKGADESLNGPFIACFVAAADDADLPSDDEFRSLWRRYIETAVLDVYQYSPLDGAPVPESQPMPHWTWSGPS
jgi:hemoglobin